MTYLFDSVQDEDDLYGRLEYERQQQNYYRAQATGDLAELLGANAAMYPWLSPGTNLSLSQAGVGPAHPVARRVAKAEAKKKTKKGFGWHSFGDVVSAGARKVGGGIGAVGGAVADVAKPVGRVVFTGLQSGAEAVDAEFRNLAQAVHEKGVVKGLWEGGHGDAPDDHGLLTGTIGPANQPTTADIALQRVREGKSSGLGEGFFPHGEATEEQARLARAAYSINGHAVTPGRMLASVVTEPGTTPYNVLSGLTDMAVDLYADPAAAGLSAASKARKASKLFEAAGAVGGGRRPAVMAEVVDNWLASADGRKVVEHLAGETDWDRLWKTFRKKVPVKVVNDLVDAHTEDEVRAVLRPVLGVEIREKPYQANAISRSLKPVGGWGVEVRKAMDGVRLLGTMPGKHLDLNDLDSAVEQLDRFQKNAKLAPELVGKNNEALARSGNRIAAYNAVANTMKDIAETMPGVSRADAQRLTKMFANYDKEYARYFVNEIGENAHVPGAVIDGAGKPLPTPHLFVEYLNGSLPLPDAREIKRATSFLAPVWKVPGVEKSVALLDNAQQSLWKPVVLLRGAWTVRVVGEEQVRMAGSGLDSVFSHPLSAIARLTAEPESGVQGVVGKLATKASKAVGRPTERGRLDLLGESLADSEDARKALTRGTMGFRDRPGVIRTKYQTLYERGHERFAQSWGEELAQLAADPVARETAKAASLDDVTAWFWSGPGQKLRKELAEASGRGGLLTRTGADDYVKSVFERIRVKTGGQDELIDAIASGKFGGEAVSDGSRVSRKLTKHLGRLADDQVGPVKVKGDLVVATKRGTGTYDRAVESLFNTLMSRPTNYLSRSRAFEQFYWKRGEELMPYLTREAQDAVIANARKTRLPADQIKRLGERAKAASGDLTAEHADEVAKAYALDSTRNLLYDVAEKSQWADAMRLVTPFAEAWKEILTRWARIGFENPEVIRRGQQVIQGARGAGFFYTSPQTGEESFVYPGSEFVTDKLLGVPLPLEGSVSGLNLFSQSILPGVGPVVQIPAAQFLPDKPEWDEIRKLLLPYGEAEGPFPQSLLPAWFRKVQKWANDPESDRQFNNTVFDVAAYLKSTGDYDTSTEEGIDNLMTEAKKKARWLFLIRGVAQFVAPTSPDPLEKVKVKDDRLIAIRTLADELHALQEKHGYQEAIGLFLDKYGDQAAFILQPKTEGGSPATSEALDFVREHPDIARKYPDVYGYFAPQGGKFDYAAYERQLASGERKAIAPRDAIHGANARLALAIYQQARSKMPAKPSASDRAWLRGIRDLLIERYPGFEPAPSDMGRVPRLIRQLEDLKDDPTVKETDAGQGLSLYLLARDRGLEEAQSMGLAGFGSANKAAGIREWLRGIGELIVDEHPDFAPMWEQIFDREMKKEAA